jgi:hypothetical protein
MRKGLALVIALIVSSSTACVSATTAPTPVKAPVPIQTVLASPAAPLGAGLASPTVPPTSTIGPASTALATLPIPTSTPAPPTPVIPSGLYVTSLDIVTDPPVRGLDLLFYATFANTTSIDQNFRWIVYIYRTENPLTSFGETTVTSASVSAGAHTEKSLGFWKLPLGGPCENFVGRVALVDQNNRSTPFLRPDGQVYQRAFVVCPPSDLPTPTPASPGQPTQIPTPPPGLFITDLRTDPNPPVRGTDLVFYPTFSNTTNIVQTFRWIVYIFNPEDPVHRIAETTSTQIGFPPGLSEAKSLGSWKLPLGGPCQEFVARPAWFDPNNKSTQFVMPNGLPFEKKLNVCPPL